VREGISRLFSFRPTFPQAVRRARGAANMGGHMLFGVPITATNIIISLNIVIYVFTKGVFGILGSNQRLWSLMKVDRAIRHGQTYRLFTSLFCHGSFMHLVLNSYSLFNLGPAAQRAFNTHRFVFIYLSSGVLANLATYLIGASPYSLGSSGSTFGLIGAFAVYFYRNQAIIGPAAKANLSSLKRTILLNLLHGISNSSPGARGGGQVDNGAHIAGLLCGAGLGYLIGPRLVHITRYSGSGAVGGEGVGVGVGVGRRVLGVVDRPVVPYRKLFTRLRRVLFPQMKPF